MATVTSSTEIPPGGEGKIEVKINSTKRARGRLSKTITVKSNDPRVPIFRLKLHATVEIQLGFESPSLNIGTLAKGTQATHTVKLTGKLATKAKITNWTTDKPEWINVQSTQVDGIAGLKITVKAPENLGMFTTSIKAETNLKQFNSLKIWIHGRVEADLIPSKKLVIFQPKSVNLRSTYTQRILSALSDPLLQRQALTPVRISSLNNKPFQIKKVEDPTGVVFGFAQPDENGSGWNVYLKQIGKPKSLFGKLYIHTDRSDQPIMSIRYQGWLGDFPQPGMARKRPANPRTISRAKTLKRKSNGQ